MPTAARERPPRASGRAGAYIEARKHLTAQSGASSTTVAADRFLSAARDLGCTIRARRDSRSTGMNHTDLGAGDIRWRVTLEQQAADLNPPWPLTSSCAHSPAWVRPGSPTPSARSNSLAVRWATRQTIRRAPTALPADTRRSPARLGHGLRWARFWGQVRGFPGSSGSFKGRVRSKEKPARLQGARKQALFPHHIEAGRILLRG